MIGRDRRRRYKPLTLVLVGLLVVAPVAGAQADAVESATARIEAGDRGGALDILGRHLADQPGDDEARFLYARVLSWEQRWAESLDQYDRLLRGSPDNADYLLGKSQVLVWSSRPQEALPLLARARTLAPDYEAVSTLEGQALDAVAAPVQRAPTQSSIYANHLEGGFSVQKLSGGLPDWTSLFAQGGRRLGHRRSVFGRVRRTERFDEQDNEIAGGVYWPAGSSWTASADASIAPGAVVLPKWAVAAHLQRPFDSGLGIQFGVRHAEYAANHVNMLTVTGNYYWRNYFAGWTLYVSKLEGADPTFANQLRIDRHYGAQNRVGLLLAAGEEVESVGNGLFIAGDTFSAVLTGLHWVSPTWGVSWELIFHDQGDAYRRGGFRVGLRRQF